MKPIFPLYIPWKHQKTICFLIILRSIENNFWHEIGAQRTDFQKINLYPIKDWTNSKVLFISDKVCELLENTISSLIREMYYT